jgi:hypothetical protein
MKPDRMVITPKRKHTAEKVIYCKICHAPVTDSPAGRQHHFERLRHRV